MPLGAWAQDEDYSKTIYVDSKGETVYITSDNAADILGDGGSMSYDADNNVLTLDNVNLSCTTTDAIFISCVDWSQDLNTLTIHLVGNNTITLGNNSGFFYGSALTFTTDDNYPGFLTITKEDGWSGKLFENSASGDPTITPSFNNHLYIDHDVESECLIQFLTPPGILSYNDGNNMVFCFGYETGNDDEEIHYSIDYVDENLQDVTDAVYDVSGNDQPLLGPCTMTYYITAGGGQSETMTAKLFGLATNSVTTTLGTPVAPPTIVPEFDHSEDLIITETQTPATGVAPVYDGTTGLISTSATGETTCSVKLRNSTANGYDYLVLNDNDDYQKHIFGNFTLTVEEEPGYDLWIGDVRVTESNWNNIQGGNIKVGYARFIHSSDGSNTLELHNIQTKDCIKSGLGDLKIKLFGHNRIGYIANDEDNPAIYSTNGGKLTLTKGDSNDASLYVESMMVESVIYGFDSFVFTEFSVDPDENASYNAELGLNDGEYGVLNATFYTGDLYSLWVGGTQVTSANLSEIRDEHISEGTMTFDPETNTLTMNNVIADMASDDNDFVETKIPNLTVKLLGTNEVTLDYPMYQTDNCFARYTGEGSETTPTLTFDTQRAQNLDDQYVFGSLTVNLSEGTSTVIDGSSDKTLVAQGYTISNTFGGETPCWKISDDLTDQVKVWYDGAIYDLAVAGVRVTSANASNVMGETIEAPKTKGSVSYDAATNTLTLDGANLTQYGDEYHRSITYYGTGNLTIAVKGINTIGRIDHNNDENAATLSFVKAEGADKCQLSLYYPTSSDESVIFYFQDVDFGDLYTISDGGPTVFEPYYNEEKNKALKYLFGNNHPSVHSLQITSVKTYPLWIINKQITEENKDQITSVENSSITFAYDADHDKNTLTFNEIDMVNKNIISGLSNLTIHLNGMNVIRGGGYNNSLKNGILSIDPSAELTFTSDVENSSPTGSLYFRNYVTTPLDGFASYNYNNGLAYGLKYYDSEREQCVGLIPYFSIGSYEITSANLSVIGDMVSYNNQTNTLSLNGIGIGNEGVIQYYQNEDITIEFDGASSIGYIAGTGNGNLYIKKAADAETPELDINGNYDGLGAISGFNNCTWEDGLYMNPYEGSTVLSGVYFDTETGHFTHPTSSVNNIIFSTEQAATTPSIWIGTTEVDQNGRFINNEEQEIEGVSFTSGDVNVLTLSGIEQETSIVSSLPNLTIKLSGVNNMSQIISADQSAELTIVKDDDAESATLNLTTELTSVISGFADVELSGMYYLCPEIYEYDTTSKKFVNPMNDNAITSLEITSTEAYPLWIAGTQVTGENASNIFDDAYASASYAGNTLTLKAYQNNSWDIDYAIMIGGEENLNIDFIGYNSLGSIYTKTFLYAKDACTVTFSTDETLPGQMECIAEEAFKNDNVTIEAGNLEMEEEGSSIIFRASSTNNIYYFGTQSFNSDYWEGDYPSGDYVWYYSNAVTNSGNSGLPPIVNSSEGTTKMKSEGNETIKSLTFQCLPLSGDAAITVALKNLEDESIVYATGTLTNGVVTLTPNAKVTYEDVCLVFTSTSNFSFIPLAVQTEIKPDAPNFTPYEEENPASFAFEFGGDEVRYTIDYASDDLEDVEETSWTYADGAITIAGPCTVTAWVVQDGVESDPVKGKYFGPASTKQTIVLGADPVELAIAPAIEEGDGIMIYGIESSYISFNETTQKATATTMGSGSFPVPLKYTGQEYEEGNTFILNYSNFEMQVEVVAALDIEFAGTNSWASYYATENLNVPEGLTAYVVSAVDEENGSVTVAPVDYIPANKAVLLKRANDGAASGYTAGAYTGSTSTFTNLLGGSTSATAISSLGSGPVYVLFNDKFKRAISGTIPARRAYLALGAAVAPTSAPQYLTISITDDNSTAIDTLTVDDSNDSWYSIDGLKLNGKPQHKGLYINNGKKVYINNK